MKTNTTKTPAGMRFLLAASAYHDAKRRNPGARPPVGLRAHGRRILAALRADRRAADNA